MGVTAHHRIGSGLHHQPCQVTLALAGLGFTLPAPVHKGNYYIGPGGFGSADVGHHVAVFAPGHTGPLGTGFERTRFEFVIAQQGDANAVFGNPVRCVGLAQVGSATKGRNIHAAQVCQGFHESLAAKVAAVVVGHRHCGEATFEHVDSLRGGAKGVDLVVQRHAGVGAGYRGFQVANGYVGRLQQRGDRCQRVAACSNQAAGAVGQHHVTTKNQFYGRRSSMAPERQTGKCNKYSKCVGSGRWGHFFHSHQ